MHLWIAHQNSLSLVLSLIPITAHCESKILQTIGKLLNGIEVLNYHIYNCFIYFSLFWYFISVLENGNSPFWKILQTLAFSVLLVLGREVELDSTVVDQRVAGLT